MREDPRQEQNQARINLFLDKEFDKEEETQFLKDLKNDDDLGRNFEKEQKIRGLIKKNLSSPGVPSSLIERIKDNFRK